MKRSSFGVIALLILAFGAAMAQTQTYYAQDLEKAPKPIAVSPGYLTVLEFYQEVDQIASGRPGLMKVEVTGSKVYVSSLAPTGSTDLIVEIGARTQLFKVSITAGNAPRRYVIALDKPAPKPAPVAVPKPAPKPSQARPARPATPSAPARPSTVAAASVGGLNDPSARAQPAAQPTAQPTVSSAASQRGAVRAQLIFADFERPRGERPVSNLGGAVMLGTASQSTASTMIVPGASSGGPALILDAEGQMSTRVCVDFETKAQNEWALAQIGVDALASIAGKAQAVDVSGYDTLRIDLASSGATRLKLELKSHDNGVVTEEDAFPQYNMDVTNELKTYRIPLSMFVQPPQAKTKVSTADVLRKLTSVNINVVTTQPAKGRLTVDNIVFERSGSDATTLPASTSSATAQRPASSNPSSATGTAVTNPGSLEFSVVRQVAGSTPGSVAVYYAVKNLGSRPVMLGARGLLVRQGGADLTASLRLDVRVVTLRPGQAHLGTIIVSGAKQGDLSLRWSGLETGTNRALVLERSLYVSNVSANAR